MHIQTRIPLYKTKAFYDKLNEDNLLVDNRRYYHERFTWPVIFYEKSNLVSGNRVRVRLVKIVSNIDFLKRLFNDNIEKIHEYCKILGIISTYATKSHEEYNFLYEKFFYRVSGPVIYKAPGPVIDDRYYLFNFNHTKNNFSFDFVPTIEKLRKENHRNFVKLSEFISLIEQYRDFDLRNGEIFSAEHGIHLSSEVVLFMLKVYNSLIPFSPEEKKVTAYFSNRSFEFYVDKIVLSDSGFVFNKEDINYIAKMIGFKFDN